MGMENSQNNFNLFHAATEQQADIFAYMKNWARIAHWYEPVDTKRAEAAIKAAYELEDLKPPTIIYCQSLWQMAAIAICCDISNTAFHVNSSGRASGT